MISLSSARILTVTFSFVIIRKSLCFISHFFLNGFARRSKERPNRKNYQNDNIPEDYTEKEGLQNGFFIEFFEILKIYQNFQIFVDFPLYAHNLMTDSLIYSTFEERAMNFYLQPHLNVI